jgi:hypothetical protein
MEPDGTAGLAWLVGGGGLVAESSGAEPGEMGREIALSAGDAGPLACGRDVILQRWAREVPPGQISLEKSMGVKKTGKGRRKLGQKKRRMRARIRHRKG